MRGESGYLALRHVAGIFALASTQNPPLSAHLSKTASEKDSGLE